MESRYALRTMALATFVLFGVLAWGQYTPHTYLHGDGAFYANINKALWNDGTIEQTRYHPHSWLEDDLGWNRTIDQGWSNVSLGRDGRWMPKHSYVLPLFSTPLYGLFGLTGLLVFHLLMMTLVVVGGYAVAARWLPPPIAAAAALVVGAQPVIMGDLYAYNNDAFISALLIGGVWAFQSHRWAVSGVLFGISVWAKATNVLFIFPFALWLLASRDWHRVTRGLVAFLVPVALWLGGNTYFYGGPLETSYSNILVRVDGQLTTEGIGDRFQEPFGDGMERILKNEREGIIPRAPFLLLAIPGALLMLFSGGQRALGASYLVVTTLFLVLHAKYGYTYARFFLPVVALSIAPLGALYQGLARTFDYLGPGDSRRITPARVVASVLALGATGALVYVWNPPSPTSWSATNRVLDAKVHDGRHRCDYFNNLHQKFECHRDKSHQQWGVALNTECTFSDEPRRMLWLHPPKRGRRTITFDVPAEATTLDITYGLAGTSKHDDVDFTLRFGETRVELPPVVERDQLYTEQVHVPAGQSSITVEVKGGRRSAWRHFCFNATANY